jgi:hypothetical protein
MFCKFCTHKAPISGMLANLAPFCNTVYGAGAKSGQLRPLWSGINLAVNDWMRILKTRMIECTATISPPDQQAI